MYDMSNASQPMNYNDLFTAQNLGLNPQPMSGAQSPWNGMMAGNTQPVSMQQAPQMSPELNHINDVIQQYVGNKKDQQSSNGLVQQILANRMQPEMRDTADSISTTAQSFLAPQLFKPVSPEGAMAQRYANELSPYTSVLEAQGKIGSNMMNQAGGATGVLMNRIKSENPGMSDLQALQLVQTGLRQGIMLDSSGNTTAMPGFGAAKGNINYASQNGTNRSNIEAAAPLEAQKKIGAGDITDVEKRIYGQKNVQETADNLDQLYGQLEQAGAAVSTKNGAMSNLSASIRGSDVGQFLGRRVGTSEQSVRNQISMQIPNLINDIRSATGMSAKAMDSNAELQFYLKMATDPGSDIEANRAALATIRAKYLGNGSAQQPQTQSGATHIYNPATGQLEPAQ